MRLGDTVEMFNEYGEALRGQLYLISDIIHNKPLFKFTFQYLILITFCKISPLYARVCQRFYIFPNTPRNNLIIIRIKRRMIFLYPLPSASHIPSATFHSSSQQYVHDLACAYSACSREHQLLCQDASIAQIAFQILI